MSTSSSVAEAPWQAGIRGARATIVPALALQAAALALVIAYYRHEPTHAVINQLSVLHERAGLGFGVISTGLFGGFIPFLYLRSRPATRSRYDWTGCLTLTSFWAYKGIEVDLWYRLLARVVGDTHGAATIATKMALDQFVYCPVLAVPFTVLVYEWIEARYDFAQLTADFRARHWYRRRALPVLISNLGVWVPAVCIIYALPTPLQLPLQNLVLCFFTILLAHVVPDRKAE